MAIKSLFSLAFAGFIAALLLVSNAARADIVLWEEKPATDAVKAVEETERLYPWMEKAGPPKSEHYHSLIGYIQVKYIHINDDTNNMTESLDEIKLNKARFGFAGKFTRWFGYKFELDMNPDVRLFEFYATFPIVRYFEIRAGQVKSQLRYQLLMSSSDMLFSDAAKVIKGSEKLFFERDVGAAISGDLFPWPELDAFVNWPKGIIRYYAAVQNGEGISSGGTNQKFMYTLRAELNPLGYFGFIESDFMRDTPFVNAAFNWGYNTENFGEESERKNTIWGIDGFAGYYGFTASGGYFKYNSAPTNPDKNTVVEWAGKGYYGQFSGFIPAPYVNDVLELKYRYQYFDPNDVEPPPFESDRAAAIHSFGINAYLWKKRIKLMLEANVKTEKEPSSNPNIGDLQIRDNSYLIMLQFKL